MWRWAVTVKGAVTEVETWQNSSLHAAGDVCVKTVVALATCIKAACRAKGDACQELPDVHTTCIINTAIAAVLLATTADWSNLGLHKAYAMRGGHSNQRLPR